MSYNYYSTPNSKSVGCITNDPTMTYIAVGYRAACSWHGGGANLLMTDGSQRSARDSVDPTVWRAVSTRAGGEPAGDF